jgi:hypothetical protein
MKKFILYVLPLIGMSACCNDGNESKTCGVNLTLVSMLGNIQGIPAITGDDMDWQETIHLDTNGGFFKRRTRDGVTLGEGGTFAYITVDGDNYLELTYTTPKNDLIESCTTADSKELIRVVSNSRLEGIWSACDGPKLTYEKTDLPCGNY